jgi:signal transduction histidine kinase
MKRLLGFAVGLVITLIGVAAMVILILQPEAKDVPLFLVLVGTPLIVAIAAALIGQRWAWWRRFNRLALAMFTVYAIGAGLILLTMFVTTRLMFFSTHDATLATVIVIYATGVTLVFGYFVVSNLTDSIARLTQAARAVQRGDLSIRADDRGSDEVATLARTFNEMTAQLARARDKERQLDQARRDWIAWVSHDLRTPLTSIRARAEALADGVVTQPQEVSTYLSAMRSDTFALSILIDDLSELAKIDAGGLKLDVMPFSLGDLVSDAIESLQVLANERCITLTGCVAPSVDPVRISPQHIQRVLNNLIGNALAHTPPGGSVTVQATRESSTSEVYVAVQDTGSGIAPEALPYVFDRFYRGERSRKRSANGQPASMGLGLAIARALVEAHGGRIGIDSQIGKGARVWFSLPNR